MAHGYAVIYVFVQVFVYLLLKQHKAKTLSAPHLGSPLGFFVCVAHFVTRSSGPFFYLFLFLGGKTPTRCVFLRISYVDALKKRHKTSTIPTAFCFSCFFSSTRMSISPWWTWVTPFSFLFFFPPFLFPATHSDTLARRCVCDKVALKKKKETKKKQRTHVIRAAAGPICHEVSFQILSFLNGCSYYCYCCHIGESLYFLSIF